MFSTKCICALAILAIADPTSAKLRGSMPTEQTNERRGALMKGASSAGNIALQDDHKQAKRKIKGFTPDPYTGKPSVKTHARPVTYHDPVKKGATKEPTVKTHAPPPSKKSKGPGPSPQPSAQSQCGASCSSNYECVSLGENQPPESEWCGECNLVHGTRGFGTCYNPSAEDDDDFAQPWTYPGGVGYTCAERCNNDSDCQKGGFVDCGTCNKKHGTEGYNTCINPPEELYGSTVKVLKGSSAVRTDSLSPKANKTGAEKEPTVKTHTPPPLKKSKGPGPNPQPSAQPQCGASCSSNYECVSLGENQPPESEWCGECNLVHGTRGFGTCYNPSAEDDDDFAQPWAYPGGVGYTCAEHCNNDSDCQKGGFVDCGTCNKVHGTEGYNTCINPPENESSVVALA